MLAIPPNTREVPEGQLAVVEHDGVRQVFNRGHVVVHTGKLSPKNELYDYKRIEPGQILQFDMGNFIAWIDGPEAVIDVK